MSKGLGSTQRAVLDWLRANPGKDWAVWWIAENLYGDPSQYEEWDILERWERRGVRKPINHTAAQRENVRRAVATLKQRGLVTVTGSDNSAYVQLVGAPQTSSSETQRPPLG